MDSPIVAARAVSKNYGNEVVLSDVSFDVGRGVTGLLGANGAGKTTLFGMFLGQRYRSAGELFVFGVDPATAGGDVRMRIGYAPEHHHLPVDLPAVDFVQHIAEIHGITRRSAVGRASDALYFVGLGEERQRPLGTLSTGQRQRVKLAMAIAHDPDLVLLDEPTDGLDPQQRDAMLHLISELATKCDFNIIVSSHLLDEVERTCDNVVIIGNGTVVASGSIDELRGTGSGATVNVSNRQDEFVASLTRWGFDVDVSANDVVVTLTNTHVGWSQDDLLVAIQRSIVESNAELCSLRKSTVSLEDVFLRVV